MTSKFNKWFIRFGFRLGLGILLVVAMLYYNQKQNLHNSLGWVIHTYEVQNELTSLSKAIEVGKNAEELELQIQKIQDLTSDNPRQQVRFEKLKSTLTAKNRLLQASKTSNINGFLFDELDEQISSILTELMSEETTLLQERQNASAKNIALVDFPIAFGGLLAFILVFLGNRITTQDLKNLLAKDQELEKKSDALMASKEALEVKTKILNLTMESMGDGLIVINEKRQYISFNAAARRLIGMSPEELNRQHKSREIIAKDPVTLRPLRDDELPLSLSLQGQSVSNFEMLLESASIDSRILSFSSQPIIDDSGKKIGATAVFRDVTLDKKIEKDLRSAQQSAIEADKLKSEFLANMSHEIRTPMNGIMGMADLLTDTKLDPQQQTYVKLINESSQNLLTIINDILDFSKIEAGKLEIESAELSLAYTMDRTIQLLAPKAREKSLNLISYINPKIPKTVLGDSGRIGQILMNLVGNAIKFTSQGKVIVWVEPVRITDQTVQVKFTVEDTGVGLEDSVIEKLFRPFTQADGSTSKQFGGTGLGLSISKRLVELMGGQIGVKSTLGVGSQFWFSIPFQIVENQKTEPTPIETSTAHHQILFFEEDPDWTNIFLDYFQSWKVQYQCVRTSKAFLKNLISNPGLPGIQMVVMGECKNFEETEQILDQLQLHAPHLPVTVLLNDENQQKIKKLENKNVRSILIRPLEQSTLYNLLLKEDLNKGKLRKLYAVKDLPMTSSTQDNKKVRILLAEDNSVNQMIAQAFLKEFGYSVHTVANGREVLVALQQSEFDLILMDCQMPEMDGFEATREIRKNVSTRLPIIALTANAMKGDEEKCKAAGMNGYLSKPFRKEQLKAVLDQNLPDPAVNFDPSLLDMYQTYKDDQGKDLRVSLIHSYLETTPVELENLRKSAVQDPATFERIAHTLKSSSAAVGGVLIAVNFQELESGGFPPDQVPEKLKVVESEFDDLKVSLEDYLKKITG